MRHPFDGIIEADSTEIVGGQDERASRRGFLQKAAAAGGVAVLGTAAGAFGAVATTLAIGEEGGRRRPVVKPRKRPRRSTSKDRERDARARKADLARRRKIAEEYGKAAGKHNDELRRNAFSPQHVDIILEAAPDL